MNELPTFHMHERPFDAVYAQPAAGTKYMYYSDMARMEKDTAFGDLLETATRHSHDRLWLEPEIFCLTRESIFDIVRT